MASTVEMSASWNVLSEMIRRIRRRWRMRLAMHGLVIVLGAALLAIVVGSWLMQLFHFAPLVVGGVRLVTYVVLAALAVWYVVRPLRRRASDPQVALYLEEHEPSLDAVVLSAVETGTSEMPAFMRSPHLVARLVDMAAVRVTAIGNGMHIETSSIRQSLLTLFGILAAGALLVAMGPEFLRNGARLLAAPAAKTHVFVAVYPGNAKVSRGGDQAIRARVHGFATHHAELVIQRGTGKWERLPMSITRDSASFVIRLFALKERTAYYVDAGGVRSPMYHLDIVDLPYVKRLALEYHYPAYTGLTTKMEEHGGDVTAPEGTSVIVRATTTMPVQGGRIAIAGQPPIPMALGADGVLTGTMPVTKSGFYKIELEALNGSVAPGSLDYAINALKDAPPTITFSKPGCDTVATPIEEVPTQIEAADDYGIATIEVRYSVNGGPEHIVPVPTGSPHNKKIVVGYTFLPKQLALRAWDMVAYYAQATDNDAIHGGKVARTNIFFLNIRPKGEPRKPSASQGNSSSNQNQSGDKQKNDGLGKLVKKQREIVVGTFNVDRDRAQMPDSTRRENLTTLTLAQNRLREEVEAVKEKIVGRGLAAANPTYKFIGDELSKAVEEMKGAEGALAAPSEHAALSPEQRALQHLRLAYAASFKPSETGQSKGGDPQNDDDEPNPQEQPQSQENPKDLASLFGAKNDQLSKQYEQTAKTTKVDDVDKLAEKLEKLAQRQLLNSANALMRNAEQAQAAGPQSHGTQGQGKAHGNGPGQEKGEGTSSGGGGKGREGQNQITKLRQAAEALALELGKEGRDTKDLEHLIDQMRALELLDGTTQSYAQLEASMIGGLKAWEYALRKHLETDTSRPVLGDIDDVPPDFKALVSEYYRSLAKNP